MDTKRMGAMAMMAAMLFGTMAGAEQAKPGPAPASVNVSTETWTLKPGESKEISVKDATRSAISDPEIIDMAAPHGSGPTTVFRLTASKVGKATLIIWSKGGKRRTYEITVQG